MLALRLAGEGGTAVRIAGEAPLGAGRWHFIAASFDAGTGEVRLVQEPLPAWPLDSALGQVTARTDVRALRPSAGSLVMAALADERAGRVTAHYNGKFDRPSLFNRALSAAELAALKDGGSPLALGNAVVAAWDFSREIGSSRVIDRGPHAHHGTAANLPARGMTGANWTGRNATSATRRRSTRRSTSTRTTSTTRGGRPASPSPCRMICRAGSTRPACAPGTTRTTCRLWSVRRVGRPRRGSPASSRPSPTSPTRTSTSRSSRSPCSPSPTWTPTRRSTNTSRTTG